MNLNPFILSGMALGLSACVGTPASQEGAAAQAGAFAVMHEGGSYQAQILAGAPGHALTRAGAQPVPGMTVTVQPLAMDQGRRAKAVAAEACAQARGQFQPQAVGRFAQGAWVFQGGCA